MTFVSEAQSKMWGHRSAAVRLAVHDFSGMSDYEDSAWNTVVMDGLFDYGVKLGRCGKGLREGGQGAKQVEIVARGNFEHDTI
jgi:hypothetical protein